MKVRIGFSGVAWLIFRTLAVCLALESGAGAAGPTEAAVTEVAISEYSSKDLALVGQIHAGHIFIDYDRWAFFRIGLLPILVAENVQIRIQSGECLPDALADLRLWHKPSAGVRRLELRNLELTIGAEKQPRLCAATARVGQDGTVKLSNVSVRDAAGRQISLPMAVLQISGPSAGRLGWNLDGHTEELLPFKLIPEHTP